MPVGVGGEGRCVAAVAPGAGIAAWVAVRKDLRTMVSLSFIAFQISLQRVSSDGQRRAAGSATIESGERARLACRVGRPAEHFRVAHPKVKRNRIHESYQYEIHHRERGILIFDINGFFNDSPGGAGEPYSRVCDCAQAPQSGDPRRTTGRWRDGRLCN